ncbi:unnamed protein product [Heligmosomoides polygyrus]|uniref:Reverse transcriptase domain-containing protein n=1 Tax=Heligmosomoides polygyrus TaxID=6339 RepID=A0A183G3K9_HELPZ|nr:unnamed protein product [Heligmosomoides polygyrus]
MYVHTITKIIEVSREYKLPLCLTFIDLKKAFKSLETEAAETLLTQGIPTQYIKKVKRNECWPTSIVYVGTLDCS